MARLSKVTKEFNLGLDTIVDFLEKNKISVERNPNAKISDEAYELLKKEFQPDAIENQEAQEVDLSPIRGNKESVSIPEEDDVEKEELAEVEEEVTEEIVEKPHINVVGRIDLDNLNKSVKEQKVTEDVSDDVEIPQKEDVQSEPEVTETPDVEVVDNEPQQEESDDSEQSESVPEEGSVSVDEASVETKPQKGSIKIVGKIDLSAQNMKTRPDRKTKEEKEQERRNKQTARNPQKDVDRDKKRQDDDASKASKFATDYQSDASSDSQSGHKNKRKRISGEKVKFDERDDFSKEGKGFSKNDKNGKNGKNGKHGKHGFFHEEISDDDVDRNIRDTMSKLGTGKKTKSSKYRRDKREEIRLEMELEEEKLHEEEKILKVTDVVSANDLSAMMNIPADKIISACFEIGLFVSLNQRLEADTIQMIAENFGFQVQFVSADIQEAIEEDVDKPEDLLPRPPIVTVMGHVDHGKTSLLDYIRKSNVIAGEAGGITQHIGSYNVTLANGRKITFLDTPGHEAFTAMRARGAQVTDIAIIVVAADDNVMPQTVEAINHAAAAGVPIVFAINKIDKPGANPDKVREQLANMNYLVEEWGGKYQSQEIAAKFGKNVDELMEKVLLEADMLDLKANPNKPAQGTVIESKLDKGRGYTTNILVSTGTLRVGDIILAGMYSGKIKAMFNEREQRIEEAGPSTPVMILGLDGAPQAGDKIHVMKSEREARDIASKRERLQREQELRAMKPETLEDIARKIKIGNVQELNLIIKGDVGGSIEALSDSLLKLSTEEIEIVIKHKAVGQISESDVLLASASKAIIIGFQVRPSADARRLAEKLGIDIRLYSIIYDAINEVKEAMTGLLSPEIKEEVTGSCEVRETFKISKVGTVAGCFVTDGKILRSSKVRVIRDGIVIFTGELASLRKVKDDVKEVTKGFECGLNVLNYNDIQQGDIIEAYEEKEVQRKI